MLSIHCYTASLTLQFMFKLFIFSTILLIEKYHGNIQVLVGLSVTLNHALQKALCGLVVLVGLSVTLNHALQKALCGLVLAQTIASFT